MTVATDEIYEKYLQKAITEINALGDEVAHAAAGTRVPVVGSGHPLADIFLLKYTPRAAELQEGVAFYGRAGNALLKSLQRLHVDPMAVYGTNCLKFADGDEEESRPFLLRELHIVQPKLVVVMGEQALAFLNSVDVPARPRGQADRRRAAEVHADDRRALHAGHRPIPRRATRRRRGSGTRSSCSASGGHPASVLRRPRVAAFVAVGVVVLAWFIVAPHLARSASGRRSLLVSVVIIPVTLAARADRAAALVEALALRRGRVLALVALLCTIARLGARGELREDVGRGVRRAGRS